MRSLAACLRRCSHAFLSVETGWCSSRTGARSHVNLFLHLNSVRHTSYFSNMAESKINDIINTNKIVIFSKTYCPFCKKVKELFQSINETYVAVEIDKIPDGPSYSEALFAKTKQKTVPNVFINRIHIGGCDDTLKAFADKTLFDILEDKQQEYDYDLIVIGGGSGGLSAAKEAVKYGKRVAVCDFVQPSPAGTTWGLGGTCVNVGCIPKKLMHRAALGAADISDLQHFGWLLSNSVEHKWEIMVEEIQNYIKSLNFGYKKQLRDVKVTYLNEYAVFVTNHEIQTTDKKGNVKKLTSQNFIIAVGGRPKYPDIPGAKEFGISSDDLFSLRKSPGKTLIVGASYIALECAGFLAGLGIDVTVMVRSILLRGFDQQIANMIGEHMESHGVKFIRNCIPLSVEKVSEDPIVLKVTGKIKEEFVIGEYNTVLFAIGRDACTQSLGLDELDVNLNASNGKIIVNEREESSVRNIFAIGDVIDGKPELTPVAIQAGRLLAMRLYAKSQVNTDYVNVPTTVFTPLEYGCVGFSEESAMEYFGADNIEVFHSHFQPLEYTLSNRDAYKSYTKLVCLKSQENLVIGLHILGPNAGEITQGFALAVKLGAKISDFHNLIGIHPTCAESITTLYVTKSSGISVEKTSC